MIPVHVRLTQQVPAKWKASGHVYRRLDEIRKPFSLWPKGSYQDDVRVPSLPKFVEHLPDQREGREGIQLLVVPVVQKGICRNCTGIRKGRDEIWKPEVEPGGKQIYSWRTPQSPELAAHVLMESPFHGEELMTPAEAVCQHVGGAPNEISEDLD